MRFNRTFPSGYSPIAVFFVIGLLIASTQSVGAVEIPPSSIASIERVVTAFMAKHGVPGLSMAIVTDGKVTWSNGYGLANLENFVPAKATTAYRSASIGKTMTAVAAMQLAERGELELNADVRRYCPAFPPKQWKVTPRDLLAHLSGIRHYGGARDQEEQLSAKHYNSVTEALAPFKDDPLLFKPGAKHLYSTYGYNVLGCVIEGAAGIPFLSYMRTHIWQPSGMTATRDDNPSALIPNRAAGYVRVDGELRNSALTDVSNRLPAGGYSTTGVDLARFAEAVLGNRLVKPETFQRMIKPTELPDGKRVAYGLGWGLELEPWHDDVYLFHGGSSPGASGFLVVMPRHRFALVFLTNLEDAPERGQLAEDVTRIVLGFGSRAQ